MAQHCMALGTVGYMYPLGFSSNFLSFPVQNSADGPKTFEQEFVDKDDGTYKLNVVAQHAHTPSPEHNSI